MAGSMIDMVNSSTNFCALHSHTSVCRPLALPLMTRLYISIMR